MVVPYFMKKYICIIYILSSFFSVFANDSNYKNISKRICDAIKKKKGFKYGFKFVYNDDIILTDEEFEDLFGEDPKDLLSKKDYEVYKEK